MELHLKVIGFLLIGLSFIHVLFPKYFNWKEDLASLSLINRQMMKVHTFFLALIVFMMGVLCVSSPKLLLQTELGNIVALGLSIFWGIRLIFQLFVYSPKLWKGKVFETFVHIVFIFFWLYMTIVFWKVWIG